MKTLKYTGLKLAITVFSVTIFFNSFCQVGRKPASPTVNRNTSTQNSITAYQNEIENIPGPTQFIVIGKAEYSPVCKEFVDHKNQIGITTRFIDLESILQHYTGDDPSKVKQAIAYAFINKGLRYVMLVGDASLFPVRHRYVSSGNEFGRPKESTNDWWYDGVYVATDHYYASLFHHNFNTRPAYSMKDYDDWDENKNFKYAEEVWNWNSDPKLTPPAYNPDNVDGFPDLVVARLPIHDANDLKIYLDKVIKYDNGQMLPQTKQGLCLVAGGTYPGSTQLCEEMLNFHSIKDRVGDDNLLKFGFNFTDGLPSGWDNGSFASIRNGIIHSWSLIYLGHGYRGGWDISDNKQGFNENEINIYTGKLSLPVVFNIGCEIGQFKPVVPVERYLNNHNTLTWYYQFTHDVIWKGSGDNMNPNMNDPMKNLPTKIEAPGPYDLSDQKDRTFAYPWLFQKDEAGGIAFFGETLVCENYHGKDLVERVLNAYYNGRSRNSTLLGDIWLQGQRQYWEDFKSSTDVFHNARIYLTIMSFFGDPTLKLPSQTSGVHK